MLRAYIPVPLLSVILGIAVVVQSAEIWREPGAENHDEQNPARIHSKFTNGQNLTGVSALDKGLAAIVNVNPGVCEITQTTIGSCTSYDDCQNRGGSNLGSCSNGVGGPSRNTRVCDKDVAFGSYELPRLDGSCQVMVEFLQFTLAAPSLATGLCLESIRIFGSVTVNNGFTICGPMDNQRIFLTYGRGERITLEVNTPNIGVYRLRVHIHTFNVQTYLSWVIFKKACPNIQRFGLVLTPNGLTLAPTHCLQNFVTSTGVVRSFSYGNSMTAWQQYTVCVQEQYPSGSIEWRECVEGEDPGVLAGLRSQFFLSNYFLPVLAPTPPAPPLNLGVTGWGCDLTTFVEVFGEHKHCSAKFSVNTAAGQIPVKSRAKPFLLFVQATGNAYIHPTVPAEPFQVAFHYPAATTIPFPRPLCSEFLAGPTAGPQGFVACTYDMMKGICSCPKATAAVISLIDPAVPARTGFCLKHTVM